MYEELLHVESMERYMFGIGGRAMYLNLHFHVNKEATLPIWHWQEMNRCVCYSCENLHIKTKFALMFFVREIILHGSNAS